MRHSHHFHRPRIATGMRQSIVAIGFGRGGRGEADDQRGGRRRRVFDSGELRLVLLKLIADQPRHGYELIRAIEELTGGLYVPSPGMVYPILTLLQDMGQIEEAAPGGARKQFTVTAEGTEHLADKAAGGRGAVCALVGTRVGASSGPTADRSAAPWKTCARP